MTQAITLHGMLAVPVVADTTKVVKWKSQSGGTSLSMKKWKVGLLCPFGMKALKSSISGLQKTMYAY
jgi:hypothetical protein